MEGVEWGDIIGDGKGGRVCEMGEARGEVLDPAGDEEGVANGPSGAADAATQLAGAGEMASAGAWVQSGRLTQAVKEQRAQLTRKTRQGETD